MDSNEEFQLTFEELRQIGIQQLGNKWWTDIDTDKARSWPYFRCTNPRGKVPFSKVGEIDYLKICVQLMSDKQFPDDLDQYIAEQKERDPEFETIFEAAVTRRCVEINTRIRQKAWEEYLRRKTKAPPNEGYTPEQLKTFMAGMFVMWRLCGLDKSPLFTFGPDNQPNNLER